MNDQNSKYNRITMLPMKALLIYLIITLLLFLFGPIEYPGANKTYASAYVIAFMILAVCFYYLGCHQNINYQRISINATRQRIVRLAIIYSFILQLLLVIQNSLVQGISFSAITLGNFSSKMAETYTDISIVNTPASWILSYTGWVRVIALTCASYYGLKGERIIYKFLFAGLIVLYIINVVLFVGSQKQLIDLIPYIAIPYIARNIKHDTKLKINKFVPIIIAVVLAVLFVGHNIQARRDLWAYRYNSAAKVTIGYVDENSLIFSLLPGSIAMAVVQVINYISHGYYGLSLCLQLPFEWTAGTGFSFKIMNDVSRWFNIPLMQLERSYPVRMQSTFGLKAYAYWHTIFPWWASDFTWIGAIIVICVFIYFWAKAWKELLEFDSIPSIIMFAQLSLFALYIPCNNQLFQDRTSIVCTIVIQLIWWLFHGESWQSQNEEELLY